ncbi:CDP-glycerol glycerophosphotransferase (TagB/SpsB family)/glycosyltransferase involved in cell wall biosynthesis [Streptacidiphilus sp. MAP12-33]|uniref:bifunctional glycosyltransferase/CDP-glycerol:glycerophosphate glycerophosphotransferase n=1 Tax=Streptacidiphilus sp. MAP12-33 TaxID=3156266 RepID=UPI00351954EA
MPRFSVIVPAYNVQAYLGECLRSVLDQSFADFELIGVDDASPDGSGRIFDEYAERDARVRVLHLPGNVGLGRARNAGMEVATGDYLIFLDSDDTLTPGSLTAIADRLDATGGPDILVFDYARTFWDGRVVRNQDSAMLRECQAAPDAFGTAEREQLLRMLMVVWNKAFKREFVERNAFTFPPGYYEDTPWTYPTTLAAETIALLDRVVVHYRQRRMGGNILATTSRKHFEIFDQYDRVFAFVDARPELHSWRPFLHRRMVEHLRAIGSHPDRVPMGDRREFFAKATEAEQRHRPEGAAAIEVSMPFKASAVGDVVRRAKNAAVAAQPGVKRAISRPLVGGFAQVQRQLPIDDDLAVFAAYWNRVPACNPAAIEAKLRELRPDMRTVWVVEAGRKRDVPAGYTTVAPGSRGFWEAMARARYLVNNVNFPDSAKKRPGSVHVQTHHGTPVKKMGLDLRDYPAAGLTMDFDKLLTRIDRWDYSLSSNRFSSLIWERVYPAHYRTLEAGYPRNDVYVTAGAEQVRAARRELGIPEGAKALLYAPTMRDYRVGYEPQLDVARLAVRLGEEYVILHRAHYSYDSGAKLSGARVVDVSRHPSIEQLALAADALIADYSSLTFDYANLDRPIVVFADDWDVYRETRGVYLDLVSGKPGETPGAVARTEGELAEVFLGGAWRDAESTALRQAFRERFCEFDDGRAAERVVRTVFLGEQTPMPFVPLADRTPAPLTP